MIAGSVFGPPGITTRIQRGIGIPGVPMWTIEGAREDAVQAVAEVAGGPLAVDVAHP